MLGNTLLRLMSLVSWIYLQFSSDTPKRPTFAELWEQLKHPEREPFS